MMKCEENLTYRSQLKFSMKGLHFPAWYLSAHSLYTNLPVVEVLGPQAF